MSKEFLYTLLDSMSVSGHEIPLQKKVIAEMTPHCDKIITDYTGNVVCVLNPDAPFKVMLAAHIDEIGLIVTHIQPTACFVCPSPAAFSPAFTPAIRWPSTAMPRPSTVAVVRSKDMDKADLKVDELYIDIGAKDAADARKYVQEGDPVHMNTYHQEMINGFLSARGIDDRGCAYIILEALKRAKAMGCSVGVYAATTVGEETTGPGFPLGRLCHPSRRCHRHRRHFCLRLSRHGCQAVRRGEAGLRRRALQQLHRQPEGQRPAESRCEGA